MIKQGQMKGKEAFPNQWTWKGQGGDKGGKVGLGRNQGVGYSWSLSLLCPLLKVLFLTGLLKTNHSSPPHPHLLYAPFCERLEKHLSNIAAWVLSCTGITSFLSTDIKEGFYCQPCLSERGPPLVIPKAYIVFLCFLLPPYPFPFLLVLCCFSLVPTPLFSSVPISPLQR